MGHELGVARGWRSRQARRRFGQGLASRGASDSSREPLTARLVPRGLS
jgi:hypothetical protein